MQSDSANRNRRLIAFLTAALLCAALLAAMCALGDLNPLDYPYRSYLLQAQAWLRGETALDRNYEYLELAVYNGRYYVSFPPVPSVPMLLWTLIFGEDVPAGLFQAIYAVIACLLILSELTRVKKISYAQSVAWAVLICFAGALLPIAPIGAVWYEAQTLAFLFAVAAVIAARRLRPTLWCVCYALSVGCRPFCAFMGPALLAIYLHAAYSDANSAKKSDFAAIPMNAADSAYSDSETVSAEKTDFAAIPVVYETVSINAADSDADSAKKTDFAAIPMSAADSKAVWVKKALKKLIPGIVCGLMIAAAYGWYNYIRFGNPLEFGHNYLPEFTRSADGQFSLKYIWDNVKTVFFGAPFFSDCGRVRFQEFGFSMFLSCPILLCQTVWLARDIIRRKMTPVKRVLLICGCAHLFFLLTHRTAGGHQFGYRYAIELIPYALAWLLESEDRQKIAVWEAVLLGFGLAFNLVGGIFVHV